MREGDVVAGRYRVVRRAGSGGMGAVYEALDADRGGLVALKTLRVDAEPRSRAAEGQRLVREAAALAKVEHPAVVRYVDHGTTSAGEPFLVMAWVAGESLKTRLQARGVTPVEALGLAARLASGLSAAHACGVVHRDLKPANIMMPGDDAGQAVIVDFGVARVARAGADLTTTGDQVGTLRYMAPEQVRNARAADARADVFSLGCILFECLAGRVCFPGDDPVTVLARILFEPLPIPSHARADLPAALDSLLATMLSRNVSRRLDATTAERLARETLATLSSSLAAIPLQRAVDAEDAPPLSLRTWSTNAPGDVPPPSFPLGPNAIAAAALRALPSPHGVFFGREDECARIAGLLRAGTPIVTIWGGPGIGKTRLAVEVVRRLAAQARPPWDALVYADLREARDADDVVRIIAREAGVSLESATPEIALGRALGKLGRVLLVVEPIEHLAALIATFVERELASGVERELANGAVDRATSSLQVLATSRRRWSPAGAVAFEVGPLPAGGNAGAPSAGARLLVDRCGQSLGHPDANSAIADGALVERAERLATALEGIPLAIELAAASIPILGFEGVLARVQAATPDGSSLATVQGPMARVLEWSWQLLTDDERSVLARCAVFRGGFTVEAAEAVAVSGRASAPTIVVLQSLRDHSLLRSSVGSQTEGTDEARLSMFASVCEFAWEKLVAMGESTRALRGHAAYYAALHEGAARALTPKTLARTERDADNLLAAAEFSLSDEAGDIAVGMRALLALQAAIFVRGALSSYALLLDRALAKVDAPAQEARADDETLVLSMCVRQARARLDAPAGRSERALADLADCLADARRRGDTHRQGTVLVDEGVVHHFERRWSEARRCYEAALDRLATPAGATDLYARARCIGNLGALAHDEGDLAGAARFYRQAMALFEPSGDVRRRAHVMGNLAVLEHEVGHLDEALHLYQRAVSSLEVVRDARLLAITLGNLGVLKLELGEAASAIDLHERSFALLADSGDARSQSLCAARSAAALAVTGRLDEAEARLAHAERFASDGDEPLKAAVAVTYAFVDLGHASRAVDRGAFARAADCIEDARSRVERVMVARDGMVPLVERSDDIRSTLRILSPILAKADARLRAARGG